MTDRGADYPFRCTHHSRCTQPATHRLVDHDGNLVVHCWICQEHAQLVLDEYYAKLGWHWTAFPICAGGGMLAPHDNDTEV